MLFLFWAHWTNFFGGFFGYGFREMFGRDINTNKYGGHLTFGRVTDSIFIGAVK